MRAIYELMILAAVIVIWIMVYIYYWDDVKTFFYSGQPEYVVHIGEVALEVTIADSPEEREQGLSGVESLGDFEGKLFIFDTAGQYGIWMKDMLFAIDVLWFNEDLELIHVHQNLEPDSYPDVFAAPEPVRFIIETNAYFVDSLKLELGDRLILPPEILPTDIRNRLQQ